MSDPQSLALQTAPTIEPVSLAEVRAHLRITGRAEDSYLTTLQKVARRHVETITGRALLTQTWDLKLSTFADPIYVPYPPLASVTSITYLDGDGDTQTLSTDVYEVDAARTPGEVRLKYGQAWPGIRGHEDVITIRYVAGWTAADNVPEGIRLAIMELCDHWQEFRGPVISGTSVAAVDLTVDSLLAPWDVWSNT